MVATIDIMLLSHDVIIFEVTYAQTEQLPVHNASTIPQKPAPL